MSTGSLLTQRHELNDVLSRAKWRSSRYKFFLIAFAAAFVWYWFPDFIFPAVGYFTWVCWIAPRNPVVNQIFGMKSGIGLLPFTFDCKHHVSTQNRCSKLTFPFPRVANCIHWQPLGGTNLGHPQYPCIRRLLDLHHHASHLLLEYLAHGLPSHPEQLHL